MFKVTVRGPDGSETNYPLGADQGLIVGRDESSDVVLASKRVSRRHARIFTSGNTLRIEDLGSQNGVFVGGNRVSGTEEMRPNLPIEIGEFKIQVKREDFYAPENMYAGFLRGFGAMEGRTVNLPKERGVVGRDATADVTIENDSVSRQHAELRNAGVQGWYVQDLGSSNGTFLNGARLPPKVERPLRPNDRINFGDTGWIVLSKRGAESPAAARSRIRSFAVFLLLSVIVVTAVLYFIKHPPGGALVPKGPDEAPSPPVVPAWDRCQQDVTDRKWPDAIKTCGDAYQEEPFVERRKVLRLAQSEMEQREIFEDANRKMAVGADRDAIKEFCTIDLKSSYFPQTRVLAQQLASALMKIDEPACREAGRAQKWERALTACRDYLNLQCFNGADPAALKVIRQAESKAKSHTSAAWSCPTECGPFLTAAQAPTDERKTYCGTKYEDSHVCDGIVAYAHKDAEKAVAAVGKAGKGVSRDEIQKLQNAMLLVSGNYKKGLSEPNYQEKERLFAEALTPDAEVMLPNVESDYSRDMKGQIADHYMALVEQAWAKQAWDDAFKACISGLRYRPAAFEAKFAELEQTARTKLTQSPSCDALKQILSYTREKSDPYKEAVTRREQLHCTP